MDPTNGLSNPTQTTEPFAHSLTELSLSLTELSLSRCNDEQIDELPSDHADESIDKAKDLYEIFCNSSTPHIPKNLLPSSIGEQSDLSLPQPFSYEDLSKITFRTEQNSLSFRFVKANKYSLSSFQEHPLGEVIPFLHLACSLKELGPMPEYQDVLRFDYTSQLCKKLEELSNHFQGLGSTTREQAEMRRGVVVTYPYRNEEKPTIDIEAKKARYFFETLIALQKSKSEFCIDKNLLKDTLQELEKYHYLTSSEAKAFKLGIQTTKTLKDYQFETREAKDVKRAISLAYYYYNQGNSYDDRTAIYWLCKAQKYLKNQSLGDLIDLNAFFQKFEEWNVEYPFYIKGCEEILEAIARCPSIKSLKVDLDGNFQKETGERIGDLLKKTSSIKTVQISSHCKNSWAVKGDFSDIVTALAGALSINQTIERLLLVDTKTGDDGVLKLVQAIENNSGSKISALNFASSYISDIGAKKLIEFARKNTQITRINTAYNNRISDSLQQELCEIFTDR